MLYFHNQKKKVTRKEGYKRSMEQGISYMRVNDRISKFKVAEKVCRGNSMNFLKTETLGLVYL